LNALFDELYQDSVVAEAAAFCQTVHLLGDLCRKSYTPPDLLRGCHGTIIHHCGAYTRTASVQAALLDDDIFPHDQAVGSHFAQLGENAVDVLVGIDEGDHDGQLTSGFDEVRGMDAAASEEAGYGVEGDGSKDIFFAQIFQDFEMQRAM